MWEIFRPVILVLLWDLLFLIVCCMPLVLLAMVKRPAFAVLRRNFVGYFMNPTGYAFLVLFVFLCSLAQFWPYAFFVANMATLDQLSSWFPLVMLTFIPAITMSIWADERRQGTDELLLTIPANDFDIVIGKYLSTAAIFTVSLLFSQVTILFVLDLLSQGEMDIGLFLSTYLGYWLAGLAMLSLGMVGSFLTSNITIGFMLAALLNLPLVAIAWADSVVPTSRAAQFISRLSISGQLRDFESGVVSLSSASYFLMLTALGLFLSMVLIGRRHWMGGQRGKILALHFTARAICLAAILVGVNLVFAHYDWRPDVTRDKVNRLHPETLTLIEDLNPEYTIIVEAYISENMPEMYAPTARDLVTLLREIDVRGGDKIEVRLHQNISVFSAEAIRASERYGIEPRTVATVVRGTPQEEDILLAAAVTMGRDQDVIPYFSTGVPVEYELIRTIVTLAGQGKMTIEEIVEELEPRQPVVIEAYLSQGIPQEYAATRDELKRLLRTIEKDGGDKFEVHLHENIALDSDEAKAASTLFGIDPHTVAGTGGEQSFLLAIAMTMGNEELVIPYFKPDGKIEQELSRGVISLVTKPKKTLGIVETGANIMGGYSLGSSQPVSQQRIVDELSKQYEIVSVDANMPIEDSLDVLLVVQPSSLAQPQIENLVDAVAGGIPTAIFEDPLPYRELWPGVPGTNERPPELNMGGYQMRATEKGSLNRLWNLLGVKILTFEFEDPENENRAIQLAPLIWQRYNPYPQISGYRNINEDWVFINQDTPRASEPISPDSPVTSGLEEVLLLYPGAVTRFEQRALDYQPLLRTGKEAGLVWPIFRGTGWPDMIGRKSENRAYTLAAHITGRNEEPSDEDTAESSPVDDQSTRPINVILVSDIDLLSSEFLNMRSNPSPRQPFRFDNVTFVLNIIDELAGDRRFIEIRKHKRKHSTLKHIEELIQASEEDRHQEQLESESRVREIQREATVALLSAATRIVFEQLDMIESEIDSREEEREQQGRELSEDEQENLQNLRGRIADLKEMQTTYLGMVRLITDSNDPTSQLQVGALNDYGQQIEDAHNELLTLAVRTGLLSQNDILLTEQRARLTYEKAVRELQAVSEQEQRKSDRTIRRIETESQMEIQHIQNYYKAAAVIYPILLPMLVGLLVFFYRRRRENLGTSSDRMR